MNVEKPITTEPAAMQWGSDYLAAVIRQLDLRFIAINPGSSLRGLHDSLVNYLGNESPKLLLCLHEDHAIAIAHGYAKVTGKPMAAAVHSNVGLMHASMGIYNAWCDRVPMVVLGATGPVDAVERRPWIDWLHTARDQGSLVRHFIKWDDQPASLPAAAESLVRARLIAETAPRGPVYLCFDVSLQESKLSGPLEVPDPSMYSRPTPAYPEPRALRRVAQLLSEAKRPVIMAGRIGRDIRDWVRRIELAERLGATVVSDLKQGAAFPTDHPLHVAYSVGSRGMQVLREADVVMSLDWIDPAGTFKLLAERGAPIKAPYVHCSPDQYSHNGWSMDHQALAAAHTHFLCEPEALVDALLELDDEERIFPGRGKDQAGQPPSSREPAAPVPPDAELSIRVLAHVLREATRDVPVTLIRTPLGWSNDVWEYRHPLDFLGKDGGAGIGSGPGMAVGAALALKDSGRLPLAVLGDGDFMFSSSALWTAAHYRIPLLIVVANNQSYFNDEIHQERIARQRHRPVENKGIAQRMTDPEIDISAIARGQGAIAYGPARNAGELAHAMRDAVARVRDGALCVIDARVLPGYES
ncbi:thiamine pyrophosphate-binding protein [uncultured Pigmentiphaga sp.]|uniref:thiamine pyrophosphate-binding protein n=1 Tax=uncultured Pigmentiphaga sp. TaxID=340361 RepID=UPI0026360DAA|nr:thiamine pyrophosphate-binding protein [uncultured Pigmentiphaga sp.]